MIFSEKIRAETVKNGRENYEIINFLLLSVVWCICWANNKTEIVATVNRETNDNFL